MGPLTVPDWTSFQKIISALAEIIVPPPYPFCNCLLLKRNGVFTGNIWFWHATARLIIKKCGAEGP